MNWIEKAAAEWLDKDGQDADNTDDLLDIARDVMGAIVNGPAIVLAPKKEGGNDLT